MPAEVLGGIARQLAPCVVVSSAAHELLNSGSFAQTGFHCVPADPSGFVEASAGTGNGDASNGVDLPIVLRHDLNGQQAQALVHVHE